MILEYYNSFLFDGTKHSHKISSENGIIRISDPANISYDHTFYCQHQPNFSFNSCFHYIAAIPFNWVKKCTNYHRQPGYYSLQSQKIKEIISPEIQQNIQKMIQKHSIRQIQERSERGYSSVDRKQQKTINTIEMQKQQIANYMQLALESVLKETLQNQNEHNKIEQNQVSKKKSAIQFQNLSVEDQKFHTIFEEIQMSSLKPQQIQKYDIKSDYSNQHNASSKYSVALSNLKTVDVNYCMEEVIILQQKYNFCKEVVSLPEVQNIQRFCKICKINQPLRVRHCHQCESCIATFDHHCPWMNNCIGQKNRYLFFIFLLMQCIQLYVILVDIWILLSSEHRHIHELKLFFVALFIFTTVISTILFLQSYLIMQNITTWQFLRWNRIQYLKIFDQSKLKSLFDKGYCNNLKYLFNSGIKKQYFNWIICLNQKSKNCFIQNYKKTDLIPETQRKPFKSCVTIS